MHTATKAAFPLLFTFLAPALAAAHPGHGDTDPDHLLHYVSDPGHVVTMLLAAALAGVAALAWKRRASSRG